MKFFNRESTSKREREHIETATERMRLVLSKEVERADAETVETRIRNLNYGSSRR